MIRTVSFVVLLAMPAALSAQIPPGDSYDPAKHVNPVITFVQAKEFKPAKFEDAEKDSTVTLMGISKELGVLESVDEVPAGERKVTSSPNPIHFYPVVRQTFKLAAGGTFDLYSFRAPQVPVPTLKQLMMNRDKPVNRKRFGQYGLPEELTIRGKDGLLFEKDGEITVVWEEEGATYSVTASLTRKVLFRILDDLL